MCMQAYSSPVSVNEVAMLRHRPTGPEFPARKEVKDVQIQLAPDAMKTWKT